MRPSLQAVRYSLEVAAHSQTRRPCSDGEGERPLIAANIGGGRIDFGALAGNADFLGRERNNGRRKSVSAPRRRRSCRKKASLNIWAWNSAHSPDDGRGDGASLANASSPSRLFSPEDNYR